MSGAAERVVAWFPTRLEHSEAASSRPKNNRSRGRCELQFLATLGFSGCRGDWKDGSCVQTGLQCMLVRLTCGTRTTGILAK